MSNNDSRLKSVWKGITWRCIATLTTYFIAWGWTGEVETASKIAGLEFFLKFAIYYLHERAWQWTPKAKRQIDLTPNEAAQAQAN